MEAEKDRKNLHITCFPPEILLKIISSLPTTDVMTNIARVSRLFNALSRDVDVGISINLSVMENSAKAKTYMTKHAHQITDVNVFFTPQVAISRQHFTHSFFIRKCIEQLFCTNSLCL